jgi:hypothetical protein
LENVFAELVTGVVETVIWRGCGLDSPVESDTVTAKPKFPVALGVPEMDPLVSPSCTPAGN